MSDLVQERRRLLRSTAAWLLGGTAVVLTRPARALEMQKLNEKSPLGIVYGQHCGGPTDHDGLISELKARLAADPSAQSLSAICPLCGCPVVVSR
jgi:hypothetical protein